MKLVESLHSLRTERALLSGSLGFVPTMGALHAGHMELVARAKEQCEHVLVSIFVNPTQFAPDEDLDKYPRTRAQDTMLCEQAGVDILWFPKNEDIYPQGSQTTVEVEILGNLYEGSSRPGHSKGVATVVSKLFNAVGPSRAFFGQKDLQQLILIKQMTRDLLFPIEIVAVQTSREDSGLALSSRNRYLSPEQKDKARVIYGALETVRASFARCEKKVSTLAQVFRTGLSELRGAEIERLDFLSPDLGRLFEEGESIEAGYCSVAVRYCGVRLIDNIEL